MACYDKIITRELSPKLYVYFLSKQECVYILLGLHLYVTDKERQMKKDFMMGCGKDG